MSCQLESRASIKRRQQLSNRDERAQRRGRGRASMFLMRYSVGSATSIIPVSHRSAVSVASCVSILQGGQTGDLHVPLESTAQATRCGPEITGWRMTQRTLGGLE